MTREFVLFGNQQQKYKITLAAGRQTFNAENFEVNVSLGTDSPLEEKIYEMYEVICFKRISEYSIESLR